MATTSHGAAPQAGAAPVVVTDTPDRAELERLTRQALDAAEALNAGDLGPALALAQQEGQRRPRAGSLPWFERLATLGAADLSVARVVEPHVDALQILEEAGGVDLSPIGADDDATWGVFAAEGPGHRMQAGQESDGSWWIEGSKPWCSLAGTVSHALITAVGPDDQRGLYAVCLDGAETDDDAWVARGLSAVVSAPLTLSRRRAVPVGAPGWYLRRPGFWYGGVGVAAVWFGGTVAVARRLLAQSLRGREPDQVAQLLIGETEIALTTGELLLRAAAAQIEQGAASGDAGYALALRTRHGIHDAAERVLRCVGHGCGPAPLSVEADHARRVADLEVYLRQDHAERDEAALGRLVLAEVAEAGRWHG